MSLLSTMQLEELRSVLPKRHGEVSDLIEHIYKNALASTKDRSLNHAKFERVVSKAFEKYIRLEDPNAGEKLLAQVLLEWGMNFSSEQADIILDNHMRIYENYFNTFKKIIPNHGTYVENGPIEPKESEQTAQPVEAVSSTETSVSSGIVRPLPPKAPALWANRTKKRGYSPPQFIQDHYGEWLGKGLTRGDLGKRDPKLFMALANWLRDHDLPEGFDLPSQREKSAVRVEQFQNATQAGRRIELPADPKAISALARTLANHKAKKQDKGR